MTMALPGGLSSTDAADSAKKSSSTSRNPSSSSRPSRNAPSLLTFALGGCCLLVSIVNVWQAHSNNFLSNIDSHHSTVVEDPRNSFDLTAVHAAVRDFKSMTDNSKNVKLKLQSISIGSSSSSSTSTPIKKEVYGEGGTVKVSSSQHQQQHIELDARHPPLVCDKFGGPNVQDAQEMVYWQDIPSDTTYVSPFFDASQPKYMTFEPDGGGWNNIRMAMETVLGLAIAMGRILVLPPSQRMYLLGQGRGSQKTDFSFADFFPLHDIAAEQAGLSIITMQEFLGREAMAGNLRDKYTGQVTFPPDNRTDWDGHDVVPLKEWLRNSTHTPLWSPGSCLAAFPASGKHEDVVQLKLMQQQIHASGRLNDPILEDPPPVDAEPITRMKENLADRKELCVYDEAMRQERTVHFMCYHKMRVRLLVHFYAFLYFEDWREDLWMKRFMRDHVRYIDEIQCAAARIVKALRDHVKSKPNGNPDGQYDSFHVRRGDFQYKATRIEATQLLENTQDLLPNGTTLFIATDERNKKFFDPLKAQYDVKFMDDFKPLLEGVNSNYYGMIDQLVAARGRIFFGCWHSTFTGFIHRMRGYYSTRDKLPGHETGILPTSYYYVPMNKRLEMHKYAALHGAFFNREFPTSWRDLDKGIGNLPSYSMGAVQV